MRRILLILLSIGALALSAEIRKELQQLESRYQKGDVAILAEHLPALKASNDEERAFISYYGAVIKKDKADALALFSRAGERYAKTLYGQMALLEAAKIQLLDRNYPEAGTLLRQINTPELPQRMYWLAVMAYGMDDYSGAVANSENYLRLSPKGDFAENALHLISDVYIEQKKYSSAEQALERVTKLKKYDRQYYLYRLGYTLEKRDKLSDAIAAYREAYELDKYSQVAYQVEEQIFALRSRRPSMDLSFLYPYTLLEIDLSDSLQVSISAGTQDTTPSVFVEAFKIDANLPTKILAKPNTGFYLQSGRFSMESNARRLVISIREMRIPAVYYEEKHQDKLTWVVLAGPFTDKEESGKAKDILARSEINSFIVQY